MQLSRISARTWFWSLTFAAFLWAYIGTRTLHTSEQGVPTSFMLSAQGVIGHPVQMLVTPGSWAATLTQRIIAATLRGIGASHDNTRTVASLEAENQKLQDQIAVQNGQIAMLNEQLRNLKVRVNQDIPPENLREANIVGRSPGAGAATITIDKGTMDGVNPGMPVIAGENHILGRVSAAGPKNATVRLITDPGASGQKPYMVKAMISRRIGDKTVQLLKEPILISGLGNGQFGSDAIKTAEAAIEKGDIVQLRDPEWPAKLQYFILGVVTDVGTNPRQMLRYEVRGRANVNEISTVEVLMKY
jgi:cell shape-determining protein MreC